MGLISRVSSRTYRKNRKSRSIFINNMIQDLNGQENFADDEPIPVPNVNGNILQKVIEWCKHHKNEVPSTEDDDNEKRSDDIGAWDLDFLKVDQGTLFELIMAANYLDIKRLLDICCKNVANMIKGKTAPEIRKTFNIKNDFTEEEEAQVKIEKIVKNAEKREKNLLF